MAVSRFHRLAWATGRRTMASADKPALPPASSSVAPATTTTTTTGRRRRRASLPDLDQPPPSALRDAFLSAEARLEAGVDWSRLASPTDRLIHARHREAVEAWRDTYVDPLSGYQVFTRWRHFWRGKCCGSACRHCPFEHQAVKSGVRRRRKFNTAFWIDDEGEDEAPAK